MKKYAKILICMLSLTGNMSEGLSQSIDTVSYITVWKTDNPGISGTNQITIPGTGTNYAIQWEKVSDTTINGSSTGTGTTTITFPAAGTYRVKISGDFTAIIFNNGGDRRKILDVEQWGEINWTSFERAYYGCSNLNISATDPPHLSLITSFLHTFRNCSSLNSTNLNSWNTSTILIMSQMFYGASSFDQPLGAWNTSNVTDLSQMFVGASAFNQPIGSWNTSKVTNMFAVFFQATSFNQPLNNWITSKVTRTESMFYGATSFNQTLAFWDIDSVTNMSSMFYGAASFNQTLATWTLLSISSINDFLYNSAVDCENYSLSLNAWAINTSTKSNLNLGNVGPNRQYGTNVVIDRNILLSKGWSINGDVPSGVTCGNTLPIQCWKLVSSGNGNSISIKTDGTLWTWGRNDFGQLGDGTFITKNMPIQIGSANNWQSISANLHSVAIKNDGTLWAWGWNVYGQLGDGTNVNKNLPIQIGTANNWKSVSSGSLYSVAIKSDGTLWAWGFNDIGQLGDGTNVNKNIPIQVGTANNWKEVSAGGNHSLAIKSDGTLWAWGLNSNGQIGDGTNSNKNVPTQIGTSTNWQLISGGSNHSMAIQSDGTLWSWGYNFSGQLGDGTNASKNIPTQIGTSTNWQLISGGSSHSIAIQSDGTLWSWGYNILYGSLGDGTYINKNIPINISTNKWQTIDAGGDYSLSINYDGTLWAWGKNDFGQLGDGTNISINVPSKSASCSVISHTNINTKALLAGPYSPPEDTMSTTLHTMSLLPFKCPYDTSVMLDPLPLSMVDWVRLDLVDTLTGDTTYAMLCACLLKNGYIQNISGDTIISFTGINSPYISLRINHRNHLSARSRSLANIPGTLISFDFRNGTNLYIDQTITGSTYYNIGQPELLTSSGRYALWPGDVNGDGQIKYQGSSNDRGLILSAIGGTVITNTVPGYHPADVSLNGQVKYQGSGNDRGIVLSSIGGAVITKVSKAHD